MSVQERLEEFHRLMGRLSVGKNKVRHYFHYRMTPPYVIWAEDGPGGYLNADNTRAEWTVHCTIDYFTKTEFDAVFDEIQELLQMHYGSRWRWLTTQYEESTNLIHHEWEVEI